MKKFMLIVFTFLVAFVMISCKEKEKEAPLKVILPSGTPLLAMGSVYNDSDNFSLEVVNGQDSLQAAFLSGEYDLIIAPFNLGAKLYLAGKSEYKLEAIITTNNTYIISRSEISDINDIKGKSVMTYGTGSSPWLGYKTVVDKYELGTTEVPQSSAGDVATMFASGSTDADYFLSAEPNITTLRVGKGLTVYALDISKYLPEGNILIQACLFVNPKSNVSKERLALIENGIKAMNDKPKEYSSKVKEYADFFKSLGENVIEQAIPNCNSTYLKAKDNKKLIDDFCGLLNKYSPKVLEGKTMDEVFYN